MKLAILQENLHNALQQGSLFIENKPQMPILSSFLVTAEKNTITLCATNLSIGIQLTISGKIEETGKAVIPAKLLSQYVSHQKPGKLTLELKKNSLYITSSDSTTTLQCFGVDDYPSFPQFEGKMQAFSTAILEQSSKVTFASSKDDLRPVLASMLYVQEKDGTRLVSTDGYRLALYEEKNKNKDENTFLLSAKVINLLAKLVDKNKEEKVMFGVSDTMHQIFFRFGDVIVVSQLTEGDFPAYEKIIPSSFKTTISFHKQELEHHVKSALVFAQEASDIVEFSIQKEVMMITSLSSSTGEYKGEMPVKILTGDAGTIAFNARYLLDFCQHVDSDEIWFGMNDSLKPGMFKPLDGDSYCYIAMPFRTLESD